MMPRRVGMLAFATVRGQILAGCLGLTMLTTAVGMHAQQAETRLAALATSIYDETFMAMNYLRSAQVQFAAAMRDAGPNGAPRQALDGVIEDLGVAQDRAMSPRGRQEIEALRRQLESASPQELSAMPDAFDSAVEIFADDGFRYRRSVGKLVQQQIDRTWWALAASLLAAFGITWLVAHRIVPSILRAVGIAQAIAAGKLDNVIPVTGQGETADLLRALSVMQGNIATAMARIHALMAAQASSHETELQAQHVKLEAALENMNQGLCLFDAADRLVIANTRFGELFGAAPAGAVASELLAARGLPELARAAGDAEAAVHTCTLADGRSIAVTQRAVRAGGWVSTYEDVSERRATEAKLAHMARHDELTGLPNRFALQQHLPERLAGDAAPGSLALLCLDLDRFKVVNDVLGHAAGDAVLRVVADRLRECTRDTDLVVRFGGDEFVIVQEATNQPTAAAALAERLIAVMAAPIELEQQTVAIGTSVGIVVADAPGSRADTLLRCADTAMYRAKNDGRGTFRFFDAAMDAAAQTRRTLELELRHALATDQFALFYQPLVNAIDGSIEGFEALIRWHRPGHGVVSPAVFIAVAEEIGLISALGEWVIARACADAALWPGQAKVAVNLSPAQFAHGSLAEFVQATLASTGLRPDRLELEITESMLLIDDGTVMEALFALRRLGVRIAMDDFGTGYSSLSYLRRFPFDKIKIDQSFVQGMSGQEDCRAIIRAVIGLGRSLGIAVNAEGVETTEQWDALRLEGCDQLQGYLFSKPRPGIEVAPMLANVTYQAPWPGSQPPAALAGATLAN